VDALAELLDVETLLLNEEFGENTTEHVVYVDEQVCIGCTLCIQACPVDAFVGATVHIVFVAKAHQFGQPRDCHQF
jgi:electron transport complex protein RnfB